MSANLLTLWYLAASVLFILALTAVQLRLARWQQPA